MRKNLIVCYSALYASFGLNNNNVCALCFITDQNTIQKEMHAAFYIKG